MVKPTATSIKVDGFKAVVILPKVSAQEFKALLNWREYKNRAGLRDTKVGGVGGLQGIQIIAPAVENVGSKAS